MKHRTDFCLRPCPPGDGPAATAIFDEHAAHHLARITSNPEAAEAPARIAAGHGYATRVLALGVDPVRA